MGNMSERRNRRAEHYMSFGALKNVTKWPIGSLAAGGMGAGVGFAGIAALKWAHGQFAFMQSIPPMIQKFYPLIGGAIGGLAAYMVTKGSPRGKAFAAGSLLAGVTINAWDLLKGQFPSLAGYGMYVAPGMLPAGGYGMLVDTGSQQLNGLSYAAMGDADDAP